MKLKWTRFNVQNRQNVKKCTPRQTTWNTFEVIILTWWKMVIDRRSRCCFFPVDIAGYEKWHLVVAIFCSQKNKPQLFCIEGNANFVWVFLYELCVCIELNLFPAVTWNSKCFIWELIMIFHRNQSHLKWGHFRPKCFLTFLWDPCTFQNRIKPQI